MNNLSTTTTTRERAFARAFALEFESSRVVESSRRDVGTRDGKTFGTRESSLAVERDAVMDDRP